VSKNVPYAIHRISSQISAEPNIGQKNSGIRISAGKNVSRSLAIKIQLWGLAEIMPCGNCWAAPGQSELPDPGWWTPLKKLSDSAPERPMGWLHSGNGLVVPSAKVLIHFLPFCYCLTPPYKHKTGWGATASSCGTFHDGGSWGPCLTLVWGPPNVHSGPGCGRIQAI